MNRMRWSACILAVNSLLCVQGAAETRVLDTKLHHLRNGAREWSEFPEQPEATHLELRFEGTANVSEYTLRIEQWDVKQTWDVSLNKKSLGKLIIDENKMVLYFAVAPGTLTAGENVLRIEQPGKTPISDDIRVGQITIYDRPVKEVLNGNRVSVEVMDEDNGKPVPCRITVITADGALQSVGAESNDHLAVRPGVIYTSTGSAEFGLPTGQFWLYAGRGFEYSRAWGAIDVGPGQPNKFSYRIRRQVPTGGYVACDTHVHTLTHSGHGDATVHERMITLAGEGIELPIATDHNVHIDHDPFARQANVRQYFTPVIGNEVTTRVGHFNVFPVQRDHPPPDSKLDKWDAIFDDIAKLPGEKVVILNHARDLHGGTRPFGPKLFNGVVGENLDGWPMHFNGMEVVNSGATQTDVMQLFRDWMGLLNRGYMVTPVGSSDSHDVARHFVGQARTYIKCDDHDPSQINVQEAVKNFLQGRVMVSYGLLVQMTVNEQYTSGDLAQLPADEPVRVSVRVLHPDWIQADELLLFANGQQIRSHRNGSKAHAPIQTINTFKLDRPKHDVHLVAIALGPGIKDSSWKTAKPYQPMSPNWEPHVIGCSGAVWLDADGDKRRTSAYEYARQIVQLSGGDFEKLVRSLEDYDEAVAAQAIHQYVASGKSLTDPVVQAELNKLENADSKKWAVQRGFRAYLNAWQENQRARATN